MPEVEMKTTDLIGLALDWVVAKCEEVDAYIPAFAEKPWLQIRSGQWPHVHSCPKWTTAWEHGGPIIEREKIKVSPNVGGTWSAQIRHEENHPLVAHKVLAGWTNSSGPTPLIAAMRCYVASRMGDEVSIPEELA